MTTIPRTSPLLAAGFVLSAVLLALHLGGCGGEAPETAAATPDASYTTQGRVFMVKTPESPASSFMIHHETIPNFVNRQGEVIGMRSHAMDFPRVAEGVDISSLEVGQPVRFTFDVTWGDTAPTWIITELEVLPEGTRFAFDLPQTTSGTTPDAQSDVTDAADDTAGEGSGG